MGKRGETPRASGELGGGQWAGAWDAGGSARHKQCWGGRRAVWRPEPG